MCAIVSAAPSHPMSDITPSNGYVRGKYVYRLSKEVFPPSASLEKEIHDRYLNNAELADWDDLKAILVNEDEIRKFIQDTGIRLQSTNYDCDNLLVSRSGGETVQGLHYHLARTTAKYLATGRFSTASAPTTSISDAGAIRDKLC